MWIIHNKTLYNTNHFQKIHVIGVTLYFVGTESSADLLIPYENEQEAKNALRFIQEGLKIKQGILYL
jgi:hypothetical protein